MKTLMIYNSKGGSGKSTICINLASYYAQSGMDVTIIDLDPQQSSIQWLKMRPISKPKITGTTSSSKIQKKKKDAIVIYDLPAAVHGDRLYNYLKKTDIVIVPVIPSPIDMRAASDFINELRKAGPVIRKKIKIGLVANRARAITNIFLELDDYLLKQKGFKYITALRDNTNYIKSAKTGLGIYDMGQAQTAQDREEFKPLIRWINSN
jgi:chromosome partitioning protein